MSLLDIIDDVRTRYNPRPTGSAPLRPIPADLVKPPRFRYPSERANLPTVCGHCGARLLPGDLPTPEHPIADLACLLCSRVACEVAYDATRPLPLPAATDTSCVDCGERERASGRRTCDRCRQRRQAARLLAREQMPLCVDCGIEPRTIKRNHCGRCRWKRALERQAVKP